MVDKQQVLDDLQYGVEDLQYGVEDNPNADPGSTETNVGPANISSIAEAPIIDRINPLSYAALIMDFNRFRAIARSQSDMYDMPGHVFFRVLFHFVNGSDAQAPEPGTEGRDGTSNMENSWTGLIAPSWLDIDPEYNGGRIPQNIDNLDKLWRSSTAFNYFMLNDDVFRANQTKQFIELLSNISTNSPWYFQNIKGLETAIDRQFTNPGADSIFKDERDKITIECLDDSYDQRIGTLLDLYRAITWSWETKRQLLPSNLRKFDMTIVAFQMPIRGLHVSRNPINMGELKGEFTSKDAKGFNVSKVVEGPDGVVSVYGEDDDCLASFKAWEFHGCEIDYNSSKSGWSELDNAVGSVPKYSIDIMFDDVFETRFNEFLGAGETITDIMDDNEAYIYNEGLEPNGAGRYNLNEFDSANYVEPAEGEHGPAPYNSVEKNMFGAKPRNNGILNQLIGRGEAWVKGKVKQIYLGNLNGLSIARIGSQVNQALSGDLWGTIENIKQYKRGNYKGGNVQLGENIFPEPQKSNHIVELGNIFRANTMLNT